MAVEREDLFRKLVHVGDACEVLRTFPSEVVDCCITSPPYFQQRDYGDPDQLGQESEESQYIGRLVEVMDEVKRVLVPEGTLWLNLGDSYHDKSLRGVPWRVALALKSRGWFLRQDIVWSKPNAMPSPVKDRCVSSHEYIFLFSKQRKYYYDAASIREPATMRPQKRTRRKKYKGPGVPGHREGSSYLRDAEGVDSPDGLRHKRSVWSVTTKSFKGAHFSVFPPDLIEPCVIAGSPRNGVVLDPFGGSGTTAGVALKHNRRPVLIELNEEYASLIHDRIQSITGRPR